VQRVGGELLDSREVALAAVLVHHGILHYQRVNATLPDGALDFRDQLVASARRNLPAEVSAGDGGAEATAVVVVPDFPAEMTTQVAAGLLGISPRAVRDLCDSGALIAAKGPAGQWRIDAGSVAALAAQRKGPCDEREDLGILRVVRARH
jgi:Helix-turn-helix domain